MKLLALGTLVFMLVVGASQRARAQSPIIVEPPATPPVQAPREVSLEEYQRAGLAWGARRSRNILIGMSAATVVGAALVFPAEANQCNSLEVAEVTGVARCTPGGTAMVAIGYPLLIFGIVGTLVSGIVFGVRKGQLRRFDNRGAQERSRAVRWDPVGSRFVF